MDYLLSIEKKANSYRNLLCLSSKGLSPTIFSTFVLQSPLGICYSKNTVPFPQLFLSLLKFICFFHFMFPQTESPIFLLIQHSYLCQQLVKNELLLLQRSLNKTYLILISVPSIFCIQLVLNQCSFAELISINANILI